jgi:acyl carrier protein
MNKEEFFRKLVEDLELEDSKINEGSSLHLTSLRTLSLISFLDEHFGLRVKAIELRGIDSVDKLMILIGRDKLE